MPNSISLDYTLTLSIFSVIVRYRSNRIEIFDLVKKAFPHAESVEGVEIVESEPPEDIDIIIEFDDAIRWQPGDTFDFRFNGNRFYRACADNHLEADCVNSLASAKVSTDLLQDIETLNFDVVECLSYLLLSWRYLLPVHASAIVKNNKAILLYGDSGVGKTSLAYAAWRKGWHVLSEDTVFIECDDELSFWGNPKAFHLLAKSECYFDELSDSQARLLPNGKTKIAIDIDERFSTKVDKAVWVQLQANRDADKSSYQRINCEAFIDSIEKADASSDSEKAEGFELPFSHRQKSFGLLKTMTAYRLSVSDGFESACRCLDEIINETD